MNLPHLFAANLQDIPVMKERRDIRGLIRALRSADFAVQTAAARALGTLGTESMDDLLSALKKKNKDIRLGAIGALAVIRDPRAVGPLIEVLHDTNSEVRWQAAFALGEIGDAHATGPLVAALRDPEQVRAVRFGLCPCKTGLETGDRRRTGILFCRDAGMEGACRGRPCCRPGTLWCPFGP